MKKKNEIPPPGQYVLIAGAIIGIIVGIAALSVSPITGAIPGALFGMGGAILGALIARPIALAVNKRKITLAEMVAQRGTVSASWGLLPLQP
ncbi:MAG: hypothetical protein ACI9G1_002832 [Pirellulaceae bacterium]|jgi:hypothetical protein